MLINGDCLEILQGYDSNTFDLIVTDPPYGIAFMGKDWDKALPSPKVWTECFRVLKEGKMAFIMCSPRQDVLSRMIISLETAGFRTNYTSIYWTYASGFPKAANISKLIDKRNGRQESEYKQLGEYLKQKRLEKGLSTNDVGAWFPSKTGGLTGCDRNWEYGNNVPTLQQWKILKDKLELDNRFDELIERTEAEREIIGERKGCFKENNSWGSGYKEKFNITLSKTEQAKKMEGAYVGFQPKPAVEVILVVSKGKSLTWLDDCRIPYSSDSDKSGATPQGKCVNSMYWHKNNDEVPRQELKGRFPANLLVSDDVLNDVSQDYSRYFDLDKWWSAQFIIIPKASKSERNKGCEDLPHREIYPQNNSLSRKAVNSTANIKTNNHHPTVKPLKLMSYLITMGSRENDLVLDPFVGSGTTYIAATALNRTCVGIELNPEYLEIAKARLVPYLQQTKLL